MIKKILSVLGILSAIGFLLLVISLMATIQKPTINVFPEIVVYMTNYPQPIIIMLQPPGMEEDNSKRFL